MISFLDLKARPLVSKASTLEGIKKGGVSSCHLGGVPFLRKWSGGKLVILSSIQVCGLRS